MLTAMSRVSNPECQSAFAKAGQAVMIRPIMKPRRRSRLPALLPAFLAGLLLAGCGEYPYPVAAPIALVEEVNEIYLAQKLQEGPQSNLRRPGMVSFCYGPALNDIGELYDSALRVCRGDYQRLIYYGRDSLGAPCAIAQPYRHTFLCHDLQQRTLIPPIPSRGRTILP